jgi:nitrite reductase/ring-hydroxylating ferredoxin subunit
MAVPEGYVAAARDDEISEGEIVPFQVDGDERILVKLNGKLYALSGICTHEYAELAEGDLEDRVIYCPLHGSGFDVQTGRVTSLPATQPLPVYDLQVIDGIVYVSREPRQG